MKQVLAGVLGGFQSLQANDVREVPVDRLTALAASQVARAKEAERTAALCSLGVDLIRFKLAHIPGAKADAEDKLCAVLSWKNAESMSSWNLKVSAGRRYAVARWAIQEWAIDVCPSCLGAKEMKAHDIEGAQPMLICVTCSGTGKRRYSDQERLDALGGEFDRAMNIAHGIIGRAEQLAVQRAKELLERT